MKVKVYDEHFTNTFTTMNLPFRQWLRLKLQGYVYIYHSAKQGWTRQLLFFIVKCRKHGYYLDYPHGFEGYNQGFDCPFCLNEMKGGDFV